MKYYKTYLQHKDVKNERWKFKLTIIYNNLIFDNLIVAALVGRKVVYTYQYRFIKEVNKIRNVKVKQIIFLGEKYFGPNIIL